MGLGAGAEGEEGGVLGEESLGEVCCGGEVGGEGGGGEGGVDCCKGVEEGGVGESSFER